MYFSGDEYNVLYVFWGCFLGICHPQNHLQKKCVFFSFLFFMVDSFN